MFDAEGRGWKEGSSPPPSAIFKPDISGTVTADVESEPVIVFAKVMRSGLPVLGASAVVEVYLPGGDLGQGLGDGLVH